MNYENLWVHLIGWISEWASVEEGPGGLDVTFEKPPGSFRTVSVVVSPADWDDYITTIYGTNDPRATALRGEVLRMPPGMPYLVYDTYDWWPSTTPVLCDDDRDNRWGP